MNRREFVLTAGFGAGLAPSLAGQEAEPPTARVRRKDKVTLPASPVISAPFSPLQIGTSAQLFVERSIVRDTEGISFRLHPAEKHPRNPLLRADRDWEGWRIRAKGNAIFDEDEKVFKMWYGSEPPPGYFPKGDHSYYAVSNDGAEWQKPLVGTIESPRLGRRHNVVIKGHHACVIKDYAEPDPSRRYKGVFSVAPVGEDADNPKRTFVSPDGLRWSLFSPKSVIDGVGDVMTASYDEVREVWIVFYKRPVNVRGVQRRSFGMVASKDFVNWSTPQMVFIPDYRDDAGSLGRLERVRPLLQLPDDPKIVNTQFYGIGAYAAESCVVAFPWIFTMSALSESGPRGTMEIQLAASRDLVNWERHFRTPCIPMGAVGEWDSMLFTTQAKAFRHNDEVWLYYSAANYEHGAPDPDPASKPKNTWSIGLARWKLDRFVSADAGADEAMLTTVPFTYTGSHLELNARVRSEGSIRVEFIDMAGRPMEGGGPSVPARGDSLRNRVAWGKDEGIVDRLRGKPVSLRFRVKNAELCSFAFRA